MRRLAKLHGVEKVSRLVAVSESTRMEAMPVLRAERNLEIATCDLSERLMDRASTEVWCLRVALGADERGVAQ